MMFPTFFRRPAIVLVLTSLMLSGCISAEDQKIIEALPTSRADLTQMQGLIREPLPVTITVPDMGTLLLDGMVTRPDRPGRFPVALISHGTSSLWAERKDEYSAGYSNVAIALAQRGWAVITVVRPGYGHSAGSYMEDIGPCEDRDFVGAGHRIGNLVMTILQAASHQSWADDQHVLLVGHSGGGFASIGAAASNPPGIVGVISFAGGDGAPIHGTFCQPERLVQAMGVFGKTTHIPSLWIYSANDTLFPPQLANSMFQAYQRAGAPATMVAGAAYKSEGHDMVDSNERWQRDVDQFLAAQKLPFKPIVELPLATIDPPSSMNDSSGREFFKKYLDSPFYEKAFAVGTGGGSGYGAGYRSIGAAEAIALQKCRQRTSSCHIYAVGNQLAP
jgi:dienelactone hydrolase